ncbi:MAG: heavy-metal-associated domain-containing protein [candidate division NC10 bacterium]|nr:heavy-metal-associated domain-containing protein [candidate division NC10 bacterium]
MQRLFKVPKIACEGCVETITQALSPLAGVKQVEVSIPKKEIQITFDPGEVDDGKLLAALQGVGYPPEA